LLKKGEILISPFYVQDEQYVTHAWMRKSDDVQDEQYVTHAWMRKSDDVQDDSFLELKGLITYG
jgi:hypothetical protein